MPHTCGKCNRPATSKITDGHATVRVCDDCRLVLKKLGWH